MYNENRSYNNPFGKVFKACSTAINNKGWYITHYNKNNGNIVAETKMSLLSWGERIKIKVFKKGTETEVQFTSESLAQIIDWGKNVSNSIAFFEELENVLED